MTVAGHRSPRFEISPQPESSAAVCPGADSHERADSSSTARGRPEPSRAQRRSTAAPQPFSAAAFSEALHHRKPRPAAPSPQPGSCSLTHSGPRQPTTALTFFNFFEHFDTFTISVQRRSGDGVLQGGLVEQRCGRSHLRRRASCTSAQPRIVAAPCPTPHPKTRIPAAIAQRHTPRPAST